ncbi:MAG: TrmJ/YjtD family RNA methyltransferase [Treponema sp.]|jgi:tRNA/rRNA methyltransferase/tRNA (cytidine32/uridine32-2'-O)-methyltransferase|nr:TrmJ/YjtD family RNA methyltransferase [Treponema sp.]
MNLEDVVIILSRPGGSGNVGAVCRAMKNMGLSRLRIAGTPKSSLNGEEALERAVHAADVWEEARFFGTLEEAAGDCTLLAGTTRRRGRLRKQVSLDPRELALWLREKPGTAALVFGSERTGLEEDELGLCGIASHIPVSDAFPSLNLSHAVQIYAYELFRALGGAEKNPVKGAWVPLTSGETGELTDAITGSLASIGFYRHPGRERQERFFRDLISRAGLTEREGRYLADIFAKTARICRK